MTVNNQGYLENYRISVQRGGQQRRNPSTCPPLPLPRLLLLVFLLPGLLLQRHLFCLLLFPHLASARPWVSNREVARTPLLCPFVYSSDPGEGWPLDWCVTRALYFTKVIRASLLAAGKYVQLQKEESFLLSFSLTLTNCLLLFKWQEKPDFSDQAEELWSLPGGK